MIYDSPLKHSLDETKCCIDVQVRFFEPSKLFKKNAFFQISSPWTARIIGAIQSQPTNK